MRFWVIQIKNDENPGFGQLRRAHKLHGFDTMDAARAKQSELGAEKRRIAGDKSLSPDTRKRAFETDYAVWSDAEVEDARRKGTDV